MVIERLLEKIEEEFTRASRGAFLGDNKCCNKTLAEFCAKLIDYNRFLNLEVNVDAVKKEEYSNGPAELIGVMPKKLKKKQKMIEVENGSIADPNNNCMPPSSGFTVSKPIENVTNVVALPHEQERIQYDTMPQENIELPITTNNKIS